MTREEAINKLVNARYADEFQGDEELTTAHFMAIKSLEQEPCEDAISRELIKKELLKLWNSDGDKDYCMETLRDFIDELPSVTPKVNAIAIPDNATNGDMIKVMFPNISINETNRGFVLLESENDNVSIWNSWWNAPYKRGEVNEISN